MSEQPTLATSFLLLLLSLFVATLLFGNLLPNHWIKFPAIVVLGFAVYFVGASLYYYFVARAPEDDEATV